MTASKNGLNHVAFLDDGGLVLAKRNGNSFLLTLADTKYLLRALHEKGWAYVPSDRPKPEEKP